MRATLRLIRFPLFITALADSAAGLMIAGGSLSLMGSVLLAGTSAFLYCGGLALNDLADRERDKTLHPGRPLPSGAVTPAFAAVLGLTLLAAGLTCAWQIRHDAFLAAGATAAFILLYDFVLKRFALVGSLAMGMARAGNLIIGMAAAGPLSDLQPNTWSFPLFTCVYIFHATLLSTMEEGSVHRVRIPALVGVLILGVIPLNALYVLSGGNTRGAAIILALLPFALLARWSFKHV